VIKEAIEFVANLANKETKVLSLNGKEYATKQVLNAPDPPDPPALPLAKSIEVATLTGFVDFVKTKVNREDYDKYLIHVDDHRTVRLLSDLQGFHKQREQLLMAQCASLFDGSFRFNMFVPHSTFMVAIQTLFQEQEDWETVTRVISTIKEERVTESKDNGMTQQVIAKAGVAVVTEVEVPRIVTLKPYRTFREVDQPASQFVLRLQAKQGELPQVALFEADGGKWKLDAIETIGQYIAEEMISPPAIVA
jgi:hypothetical protein